MNNVNKNIGLLATCQALLLTNNAVMVATAGLAGFALATDKTMATLPMTFFVGGAAATTMGLSMLMKRIGRRNGFSVGTSFGVLGALLCAYAIYLQSFWVLCIGTAVMGVYNATGQYYRFAAADVAAADFKAKAISLVLAGGIVGAVVGPESSKLTRDLWMPFAGSFLSLAVFAMLAILVQRMLDIPPPSHAEQATGGRPLCEIARQPAFIVAVATAAVSFGVMNLLMTATPLAMMACQYPFKETAFVIEWHILGMFVPSFFTGSLIKRFGVITIMMTGLALNFACVAFALSGFEVWRFWAAMVTVGVGWNFMYVGATSLLTETYKPAEKARAEGFNESAILVTLVVSSASSGALFTLQGWERMNWMVLPLLALTGVMLLWLGTQRRGAPAR